MRNGIVVVVEGVNTGLVGAYGSNTAVTPAIDRLAAHGLVLDQCFVDSIDLPIQLRSLWTGRHAAQETGVWSMWHQLVSNGLDACLITDCPITANLAEQLGCPRVTLIEVDESVEPAEDWTECALMQVFVSAVEELSEPDANRFVWIHSRGLRLAWDAPVDLRERFIDPEDPEPPSEVCVPDILVTSQTDPDEIIGWGQVAAAQVSVIDQAIDILINAIESREDSSEWSCMVASLGGVPLGEHGRVGWGKPSLHGEEVSCMAIIGTLALQEIELQAPGSRRSEVCQLPDLLLTFLDSLHLVLPDSGAVWGRSLLRLGQFSAPSGWSAHFQSAFISAASEQWIRTPAWSSIFAENLPTQLYVKPDDRWETSDVASRRMDVVDRLRDVATEFQECLRNGNRDHLPTLEDDLCNLLR